MTLIVPVLRTWMRAVSEISRAVNVAAPRDEILARIAELARDLIGFDFCAVMLGDEASKRLEIVGWSGLSNDYVDHLRNDSSLRVQPDSPDADSPAARAFRDRKTVAISDVDRELAEYGRLRLASLQGYKSLVASPLQSEDRPIGVLVGYSVAPRMYGAADLELAELLAEQTATAIHTAALRERREWAERQHRSLMRLVLDDVGLDGLVNSLSTALKTAVAVVDPAGQVVAAAGGGVQDLDWDEIARHDLPLKDERGYVSRFVRLSSDAWVTPVHLGGDVAARLWVIGDGALGDTTDRRMVEQFALVVGIEMLTARHALEVEERLSGDLLADILRQETPTRGLLERSRALGFDLEAARNVVVIVGDQIADQAALVARHARSATRASLLATSCGDDVVLLIGEAPGLQVAVERARRQISERLGVEVHAVISPDIVSVDDIALGYRTSATAAMLRSTRGASTTDLRSLSVLGLLLMSQTPTPYLRRLSDQLIRPMAEQDRLRDAQLVPTLRAWLESGFSTMQTARALTVHVNTVGQRLGRIEKLTGTHLRLPDTRLDFRLALHIWDISEATFSQGE